MSAQPEYLQASPTVYGFDFNALAGVSGSVPDSDSAPVVRHDDVMRTGNDAMPANMAGLEVIEQPAQPPRGHASTIPGYPWQGHPQVAYSEPFMGPEGTSPMRRGGPNVGAYAVAPEIPRAYQGTGYPYATPGTYTPTPGQTPFGGYAGPDLGGREERLDRRMGRKLARQERKNAPIDVRDPKGEYVYRLHSPSGGGMIEILASPRGGVGNRIYPGQPAYNAIIAEVGSWEQNRARQRHAGLSALAQGITAVTQAATGGRRRGGRRRGRGRRGGPPPYTPPPEESKLPGWVVPAAVGGVALTLLVVAMSAGKGNG